MKKNKVYFLVMYILIVTFSVLGCANEKKVYKDFAIENYVDTGKVKDYFKLQNINFKGQEYKLYYSAVETAGGFKHIIQEYVPSGQTVYDFDNMITLHAFYVMNDYETAKDYAIGKIEELNEQAEQLPYSKAGFYGNGQEQEVVEFIMSDGFNENSPNKILEWGIFRFVDYKNFNNEKYVVSIEFSERHYGEKGSEKFVNNVKSLENKYVSDFKEIEIPKISFPTKSEWTEEKFKKY